MMDKKTILVIEDEKGMRDALREALEGAGYNVITAEDGEKGIELSKSEDVDVILLDIILPKKDGFEVLKELKENEETKEVPIILNTNLSEAGDIQKAIDLGATTYLVKSNYSLDEITNKIAEVLG